MTQQTVPVSEVVVGENPRTYFDTEDQEQLERSIKAIGLLSPITVEQTDANEYQLIAGERRLRAYRSLGIEEIPAFVTTVKDAAGAAIAENVVRKDLHPIEEGRAYLNLLKNTSGKTIKPATLAKQLGIPAARITSRIRLAQLPTSIADAMISGHSIDRHRDLLTLFVEKFGRDLVAEFVESELDALDAAEVTPEVFGAFDAWLNTGDKPVIHDVFRFAQSVEGLREILLSKGYTASYEQQGFMHFHLADDDAARAYGCLVVFEGISEWGDDIEYYSDTAWVADRLLANAQAAKDNRVSSVTTPGAATTTRYDANGEKIEPTAEEKAEKRQLAAAAKQLREEHGRINAGFGVALQQKLATHKLTKPDAELLVRMALDNHSDLANCWELLVPEAKIEGLTKGERDSYMVDWICKGKNVDQIIGRFLQIVLAMVFHDPNAVVPSRRPTPRIYHLKDDPQLGKLFERFGNPEIVEPWVSQRIEKEKQRARWDAEMAEQAAARASEQAGLVDTGNTDGETTPSGGEFPIATGISTDDVTGGTIATEDGTVIAEYQHVDADPDPTTEPTVSPEEADEPLLSEQVAAAGVLVDEQARRDAEQAELDEKELEIQAMAQRSRDALAAEQERVKQDASGEPEPDPEFVDAMEEIS